MRVRVACDADPMCGSSTVRGALEQPRVHFGLALEHVEAGGEQPAVVQRVGERVFVDHRAARGVHEHRGRLHQREPARVDEVAGRVAAGHVQRHDVGRREQLVEVGDVAGLAGVGARVVQHLHAEARRAARDRAPDAAVADDAERRAVHVSAEILRDPPPVPAAGAQVGLGVVREPRRGEDQREREIGGGLVEHAGRVAHDDAVLVRGARRRCCRSRPPRSRPPAAGRPHPRSITVGVDLVGEHRDDRVDLARVRDAARRA